MSLEPREVADSVPAGSSPSTSPMSESGITQEIVTTGAAPRPPKEEKRTDETLTYLVYLHSVAAGSSGGTSR